MISQCAERLLFPLGLTSAVFLVPEPVVAQDGQNIGDEVECDACISVEHVTRIGSLDGDDALPGIPMSVTIDNRGRYWLMFGLNQTPMVVDAGSGTTTRVGSVGDGPGEFRYPSAVAAIGDSIAVADPRVGRLYVLDEDFTLVRSARFADPVPQQMIPLRWPDAVVLAGPGRGSDIVGWPIHVVDMSGEEVTVTRSVGDNDGTFRPGMSQFHLRRRVALSSGSAFWSVSQYGRYEVVKWSDGGRVIERIARSASWFPSGVDALMGNREMPPKPAVVGLHEDDRGLLLVVLKVPRPDWQQAWADVPDLPNAAIAVPSGVFPTDAELFQVMVEVIDLDHRRVVGRTYFEGLPLSVLPDGTIAVYSESEIGVPYVDVYRPVAEGG